LTLIEKYLFIDFLWLQKKSQMKISKQMF
jgi:hypothetical protein